MHDEFSNQRRSIRIDDYDYAQPGAYFITMCAHNRKQIFGRIRDGQAEVSRIGQIVREEWWRTEVLRPEVLLDQHIIMPNHLHAILHLTKPPPIQDEVGAHRDAPLHRKPKSLGAIVGQFKGAVTLRVRKDRQFHNLTVWQRNYYERVIRNDFELNQFRRYILENPLRWELDRYYVPT